MTKETKQDVFDGLLKEHCKTILDLNPASAETDVKQIVENVFRDRYAAALPDDLPVIPQAVGEFIRTERPNGTSLAIVFHDAAELNRVRYQGWKIWQHADEMLWAYDHQDAFAQAWLLGVWRVEGTGEIVKLEAEK